MEGRILRRIALLAGLGLAALLATSCNSSHISVLRGNYAFGRGQYQTATVHYLTAEPREDHRQFVDYSSGNHAQALGELDAALQQWDVAATEAPDEILFGVHFNRGVLYYELAQYASAYVEFRRALEIDGTSVDAKINLELSLQRIGAPAPATRGVAEEAQEIGAQTARVLEYIRRKERQRWSAEDGDIRETEANDW